MKPGSMSKDRSLLKLVIRRYTAFFLILVIIGVGLAFVEAFVIRKGGTVIDAMVNVNDINTLKVRLKQFVFLYIISLVLQFLLAVYFAFVRKKVLFYVQSIIFKHLLYLDLKSFYRYKKGDIAERINSNIQAVRAFFDQSILEAIKSASFMLFTFFFLFKIHPRFVAIYSVYIVIAFAVSIFFAVYIQKVFQTYFSLHAQQSAYIIEVLNGFIPIKVMVSAYRFIYDRFILHLKRTTSKMFVTDVILFSTLFSYVATLGIFVMLFFVVGGGLVSAKVITVGSLVSALMLFLTSSGHFNRVNNTISQIKSNLAALSRAEEFLLDTEEVVSSKEVDFKRHIKLEDVYFSYESDKYILRAVDLTIKKGEFIGVKGITGTGKTTLLYIIVGLLRPTRGRVLIDDVELDDKNVMSYRRLIGFLPQEPFIINASLKDNILFGEEFNRERFNRAIEDSGLKEFFKKYGENYDMPLEESGMNLSQGEKHRIHLARILYRDPEVFIFDEPTASVDTETERIIVSTLKKLNQKGKTVIVVSHKPSPLEIAGRVYELREGRLYLCDKTIKNGS